MKNLVALQVFFIFTASFLNAQNIGINKSSPLFPVDIVQPAGVTLTNLQPVLNVQYTGTNNQDAIAIKGTSLPIYGKGIGGVFTGGYKGGSFSGGRVGLSCYGYGFDYTTSFGILAEVTQNGAQSTFLIASSGSATGNYSTNFGGKFEATGDNSGNYGLKVLASGAESNNFAIYGSATSGNINWAGYFDEGDVHIQNKLGIGQLHPTVDLDIQSFQAVAKLTSTSSFNGAVLVLQNTTAAPTLLGAINFGDGISTHGQIAYYADHHLAIRVNNSEKLRINSSGLVGIGRTPTTNKLEVEGSASKSSSGDWLANSDARLKKNIQPLDEKDMIEKLLALKGVTYEWNDDKTGTERPEGIQYGFTAQNIQEVFPTLVEEDAKGYLQTAYGTYDAMMIEALRYLYLENQSLKSDLEEIRRLILKAKS